MRMEELGTAIDRNGVRHYMFAFGSRWTKGCQPEGIWNNWTDAHPIGSPGYLAAPVTCMLCIAEEEGS